MAGNPPPPSPPPSHPPLNGEDSDEEEEGAQEPPTQNGQVPKGPGHHVVLRQQPRIQATPPLYIRHRGLTGRAGELGL